MLSAVILTHNESEMLSSLLKHLDWVDEIVILDKKSTDNTVAVAQKYKCKIVPFKGERFDEWRNLGIYHSTSEWILYIDLDERVTQELKNEILAVVNNTSQIYVEASQFVSAYKFPRRNYWWGRKFTACGASNEFVTRLFKKDSLIKWFGEIHESPQFNGKLGELKGYLSHYTHRDMVSGLKKSINWTSIEAKLMLDVNHPPVTWWRLIKVTIFEFIKKYFIQRGFTHGTEGLIESSVQAWNRFMVYEQLWEMQQNPSLKEKYEKILK